MAKHHEPHFVCPICGADVTGGAKVCPECGSDDETGWSQETDYDDLDLPDNDVDYEEAERLQKRNPALVIAVIVMIAISLLLLFMAHG